MTARQKEIQTICEGILTCKKIIAAEEGQYAQSVADVEAGMSDPSSSTPKFYRNSINETKGWLKAEEERLAVLLAQEARS